MGWADGDELPVGVDLYVGGDEGWIDITATDDVRLASAHSGGGIAITRGRSAEGTVAAPGSMSLVIDNTDGAYSSRNPRSPYYGLLGRNTPIRVGIELTADDFARTVASGWGTADSGQTWSASAGASVSSGAGRHSHSTTNLLVRTTLTEDLVDVEQVSDITIPSAVTGADAIAGHMARYDPVTGDYYWLYLQLVPGSTDVALIISKQVSNVYTEMAASFVDGLAYAVGQPLRLRTSVVDGRLNIRVWDAADPEPSSWTLTATDTDLPGAGRYGCQSWLLPGNSSTKPFVFAWDAYRAVDRRAVMEVPSWPARWSAGGSDVWSPIQAAGILRRLSAGSQPAHSPLRRTITAAGPLAYWPLEDEADATEGASAIAGVPNMLVRGAVEFGAGSVNVTSGGTRRYGTKALPSLTSGGALDGVVPAGTSSPTAWAVAAFWQSSTANDDDVVLLRWGTPGTHTYWQMAQDRGGVDGTYLEAYNPTTGSLVTVWSSGTTFAGPADLVITAEQNGANIDVGIKFGTFSATASVAGTLGRVSDISLNPDQFVFSADERFTVGHVRVWDTADIDPIGTVELFAWITETVGDRLTRLAAEDGVPLAIIGAANEPMGPQPDGRPLDLYQDCVAADGGILYESRETLGLVYRTRSSLYNLDATLDVDYADLAPPLEPEPDDFALANDVTVSRPGGSSARAVLQSGPLSIQAPPDGVGTYVDAVDVNTYTDAPLQHIAGWRRHLGTWDEERYPRVTVLLHRDRWRTDPEAISRAAALDSGLVLSIDGLPDWIPPGPIRLMVQGATEVLDAYQRTLTWVMEPADPYTVGVVEDEVLGRADTDGSELASDFDAGTDTSMSVAITAGPLWITTADQSAMFPLEVTCGGVVLEVTGISGGSSPQTFTVTAAPVNGVTKTIPTGTPVSLAHPWRAAL